MTVEQKIKVDNTLNILHNDAKKDLLRIGTSGLRSLFRPLQPSDFKNIYLPISKEQGESIRQMIIDHECKEIVEFGTSFGISTIYLADAARETQGRVTTTELIQSKGERAEQNLKDAGLDQYVDIRIGDAMETLKDLTVPIDFLFLDGWKDLYLPLFKMLEPRFAENIIVYADNMDMAGTRSYGDYVNRHQKFDSKYIHQGKGLLTKAA